MPSSTGMGAAELDPAGNSGNPSTSQKPTMQNVVALRKADPSKSSLSSGTRVTTVVTKPSNTSVGQPPSIQKNSGASVAGSGGTGSSVDLTSADTFRQSDNPAKKQTRQFGEPDVEKVATLSVRTYDNSNLIEGYTNFFLQSVSEAEQEKYQVVETFTAYYAFFYGKRPPIYTYSGFLLNDSDNNWMNAFRFMYENYLRGTASAELGAETVISYDKRVVSGFLLNLSINQDAVQDKGVPFSFSVLVITHELVEYGEDFQSFLTSLQEQLASLKDRAAADIATLNKNPDSLQTILKNNVLQGKVPTAFAGVTGSKMDKKPDTSVAGQKNAKSSALTQAATAGSTKTVAVNPILNELNK